MTENITLRRIVYDTLEAGRTDTRLEKFADLSLMALIALNVVAVIMESVPAYHETYGDEFYAFEVFSVIVFTIEYFLRVWSTPEHKAVKYQHPVYGRIRYMLTPMALLDLIVILPFYLSFFFVLDLRVLRVLRLFRVFRLSRYSSAMVLLSQVLREEAANISAALFVLMMLIILAASVTFLAEQDVQPEAFGSIPAALWWAIITMTTIGYGDVVPMTTVGKVCGALIGIVSVGMVALPAGILASGFNEALHQRRKAFEMMVQNALADGSMSDEEWDQILDQRLKLGISDSEAASIVRATRHHSQVRLGICPHCHQPIRGQAEAKGPKDRRQTDQSKTDEADEDKPEKDSL